MAKVSFIGLGVMGFPMAGHLSDSGHEVSVYNRTSNKSEEWESQFKGKAYKTPREAAIGADFVMACVGNDDDLREICLGEDGAFKGMKPGTIFVDHTTVSAKVTRELANISKGSGVEFIDAPVSGGQAGAINGQLGVMCGGDPDTYIKAEKIISSYAKVCKLLGPSGAGQLTKMVNQICIAGLVQGLSEGINFGIKSGLNMEDVIEVISKGAAQSWQMDNRYETMIDDKFEFGFAVDWMRKDLKIAMEEAKNNGSLLPITEVVDKYYGEVQEMGGNRWDTSSLIKRLSK